MHGLTGSLRGGRSHRREHHPHPSSPTTSQYLHHTYDSATESDEDIADLVFNVPSSTSAANSLLQPERHALLERIRQLSSREAETAAALAQASAENASLSDELNHWKRCAKEATVARRAARDALSQVSAENARLAAAYNAQRVESEALREALAAQGAEAGSMIHELQKQVKILQQRQQQQQQQQSQSPLLHTFKQSSHQQSTDNDARENTIRKNSPATKVSTRKTPVGVNYTSPTPTPTASARSPRITQLFSATKHSKKKAAAPPTPNRTSKESVAAWEAERKELLQLLEKLQDQLDGHITTTTPSKKTSTDHNNDPYSSNHKYNNHHQRHDGDDADDDKCSKQIPGAASTADQERQQGTPSQQQGASSSPPRSATKQSGSWWCDSPRAQQVREQQRNAATTPVRSSSFSVDEYASPVASPSHYQKNSSHNDCEAFPGEMAVPLAKTPVPNKESCIHFEASFGSTTSTTAELHGTAADDGKEDTMPPIKAHHPSASPQKERSIELHHQLHETMNTVHESIDATELLLKKKLYEQALEKIATASNMLLEHFKTPISDKYQKQYQILTFKMLCLRAISLLSIGRFIECAADCCQALRYNAHGAHDTAESSLYCNGAVLQIRAEAYYLMGAYALAVADCSKVRAAVYSLTVNRLKDAKERLEKGTPRNHYAVLGIKPSATSSEIKSAYKSLALKLHPDKASELIGEENATEMFSILSSAHAVLSNGQSRRAYDLQLLREKYSNNSGWNYYNYF